MRRGAAILAGGKASRMGGRDKAALTVAGETFLDRLAARLDGHDELILSVDRAGRPAPAGFGTVADELPGCGPLGGLTAALRACRADALLAVAVDMPLFEAGLGRYVWAFFDSGCDAAVVVDRRGCMHPLCGVYGKSCLPVFERFLAEGRRRLGDALAALRVRQAPLEHSAYPDSAVANVNTPAAYAALRRMVAGPPVLAVAGAKNSGKTTLLRGVIPLLAAKGLRVGAIKHDGHDFVPDVPGTDSFFLREAGAERVAAFSRNRCMTAGEWNGGLADLLPRFADMDLILVEGMKRSALPKIEAVGRNGAILCDPSTLLATVGDADPGLPDTPFFRRGDCAGIAALISRFHAEGA